MKYFLIIRYGGDEAIGAMATNIKEVSDILEDGIASKEVSFLVYIVTRLWLLVRRKFDTDGG